MSLVFGIRLANAIILGSDTSSFRLNDNRFVSNSSSQKLLRIKNQLLVVGYVGVRIVGEMIHEFVQNCVDNGIEKEKLIAQSAGFVCGVNNNFQKTSAAELISQQSITPLTGIILAGYINGSDIFVVINPDGYYFSPRKYALLGYSADLASKLVNETNDFPEDTQKALTLVRKVIRESAVTGFSNPVVKCIKIEADNLSYVV